MNQQYVDLIQKFSKMTNEDKQEEIQRNLNELLELLFATNNSYDSMNEALPIIRSYTEESEYYDALFTSIISLKEEVAKLIENRNIN